MYTYGNINALHAHIYTRASTYMHTCIPAYMHTYIQIVAMLTPVVRDWARARGFHPSVRMYVCMYVCMYAFGAYVCMYVCMHTVRD